MDEIRESRIDGDCFLVAANIVTGFHVPDGLDITPDDEVRLVHGLPVGRGTINGGRRYWHAWVEVTRRVTVPELFRDQLGDEYVLVDAVDYSSGQDLVLPQAVYYGIGQLDERHVWRYTLDQARDEMLVSYTYGPWVDGWEGMEEV